MVTYNIQNCIIMSDIGQNWNIDYWIILNWIDLFTNTSIHSGRLRHHLNYIMDVIFTILVIHGLYQMAIRKFEMLLKSPHHNAQFFRWFWNHIRSKQGLSVQSIVADTNHSYNSTRNLEQWGSAMRTRHLEVLYSDVAKFRGKQRRYISQNEW